MIPDSSAGVGARTPRSEPSGKSETSLPVPTRTKCAVGSCGSGPFPATWMTSHRLGVQGLETHHDASQRFARDEAIRMCTVYHVAQRTSGPADGAATILKILQGQAL